MIHDLETAEKYLKYVVKIYQILDLINNNL